MIAGRDRGLRLAVMPVLVIWLAACATAPAPVIPAPEASPPPVSVPPVPVASVAAPAPVIESPPFEPVEQRAPPPALPMSSPVPVAPAPASASAVPAESPASAAPAVAGVAPPLPAEPTEEQVVSALVADLQRMTVLAADDLRRETGVATQTLTRQRTDANRIRLAMLYTLSRNGMDDQRALQLLDSVIKGTTGSPAVRQLAVVLQVQVAERVRAVREEQQKTDAAVQKLEALRAMERSLLRDRVRSGGGGGGGGGGSGGN